MSDAPAADELLFLPLGGTGEIGMNLNLYGHDGAWLMVDLGVMFADASRPGVDVLMPDPSYIEARRDQLVGLVLTHAHEDHIGAVGHLWQRLRCPIYATAFTAAMVQPKLIEAGIDEEVRVIEVPLSGRFTVGPFEVELITLTHSIPEPNALVIRTAAGTVLHTGDWKLDPDPLIGETYDEKTLRALSKERVLAMVCDSTNAMVAGESGSEAEVRKVLMDVVAGQRNRVAIACFSSNVARVETAAKVAAATGRRVCLVGRSMLRVYQAARDTGYLGDMPPLVSEEDVAYLPRHEVLLLCTGSQGEPRSALWRIANGENSRVALEADDTVIFSSRIIPGNEKAIAALQNQLSRKGVEVITADDHDIHVSGHPAREELTRMYQWVQPQIAVPVHGEARHLAEHARLARACQVPQQIVGANGTLMRLAPAPAEIIDHVTAGYLALEGGRLMPLDSAVLRSRQRLAYNGAAAVTLVIGGDGLFQGQPIISVPGVLDEEGEEDKLEIVIEALTDALRRLPAADRRDDATVKETARLAVRRAFSRMLGKKPVTHVHVVRLS